MIKNILIKFLYSTKLIRIFLYKFLQKKKYKNFLNLKLKQNSVVLDFGANTGIISQCILDLYNCSIYCYEPHNYAFKVLAKRFKNNEKITLINKSVGDKNDKSKLYYHKLHYKNFLTFSSSSSLLEQKDNVEKKTRRTEKYIC